jgi:predicted permease
LTDLPSLFLNNLLPIFLIAGSGYLLSRLTNLSPHALSQIIFYLFSPCLIFNLLTQSQLSQNDILRVMMFSASVILSVGGLTWLIGSLIKLEKKVLAGTMLVSMFINAGNYGLPVVLFAFGETALSYASVFFVTNAILSYSVGVFIASMGSASLSKSLGNLFKVPAVYALIVALVFMRTGWEVPPFLDRSVTLLANASIPAMLVLLGIQFTRVTWSGKRVPIILATGMRLFVSPAIAFLFVIIYGISGSARQAGIIQSSMPSAVLNTVISTEYDAEPTLVSAAVFVTTVLSPFVLTPLLSLLGA